MLWCNVSDAFLNQVSNSGCWQVYPNFVLECLYNIGSLKKWCLYKISITAPTSHLQTHSVYWDLAHENPKKNWPSDTRGCCSNINQLLIPTSWVSKKPDFSYACSMFHVFVAVIYMFFYRKGRPLLRYSSKHLVAIHHVLPGARWREPADAALPIHCPHSSHIDIEVLFMEI